MNVRVTRFRGGLWLAAAALAGPLAACQFGPAGREAPGETALAAAEGERVFSVHPIGKVVKGKSGPVRLEIDERYADGLLGLAEWSHVQVIYWFDQNDTPEQRAVLQVRPRGDASAPMTGVFACRSPVRPNLLALSTCRILSVEGRVVTVEDIDAFDSTPILDLKPYSPGPDGASGEVRTPEWARKRAAK
ncbi:MAG: tRNA (N6-threonylcarbamoyladenosine(37)-N6)-methyltransferase TrmO [Planctomycetes bacterium]|nr:tRNA (N6-threonylcarbamoyladenosine(37)-N6)-methyltransferase TrmO [Planctomycetota bacterium]